MTEHLRRLIPVLLCCIFVSIAFAAAPMPLAAQASQATGSQAQTSPALPGLSPRAEASEPAGIVQRLILQVRSKQQTLQRDLVKLIRDLKSDNSGRALLLLLGASFLYGIFHAAGPGHGKLVISSYLLASEDQIRRGINLTFLSSAAQAASAILLVGLLTVLLDLSRLEITSQTRSLEIISYGLVIAIGLWMLNGAVRGKGCGHDHHHRQDHAQDHEHEHHHGHEHHHHAEAVVSRTGLRQYLAVILAVGIRPCSGAVIVLLFTLAQGLLLAGIAATFAMALGTAITVSALAILSVTSRKVALRIAGSHAPWQRPIQVGISVLGSLLVIGFGVILLLASLEQQTLL
jgi:ABC-type nickel/cobalt efflux system permease component RcnA